MRENVVTGLAIALIACLSVVPSTRACDATPPDLHARQVGDDIALSWTGVLGTGDTWSLVHGDLNTLWDAGFSDSPLATVSVEQYTDTDGAADADWEYFRVRCEGAGGDGPWSNVAFKALRQLDTVTDGAGAEFLNYYHVSLPERLGIPDVADTSDPSPCAPASGVGDGILNADDLLCSWWTSGQGSLMVSAFDADHCRWLDRMIILEDSGGPPEILMLGAWTAPLAPGQALQVIVTHPAGGTASLNSAVMVGSADPARPCRTLREPALGSAGADCAPRWALLSIPWDAAAHDRVEMLCGYEGTDWTRLPDGRMSGCPGGLFNDTAGHRKTTSVGSFDNVDDDSTDAPDNSWTFTSVAYTLFSGYSFHGCLCMPPRPTDAVLVPMSLGHGTSTYCPVRR